jgi:hypothetical protein
MNAKEITDLSMMAQEIGPSMLDYMGNHVVFRPSVLTGHAG